MSNLWVILRRSGQLGVGSVFGAWKQEIENGLDGSDSWREVAIFAEESNAGNSAITHEADLCKSDDVDSTFSLWASDDYNGET